MADSVLPVESAKNRRFYQRVASSNHSAVHSESGQKTIDRAARQSCRGRRFVPLDTPDLCLSSFPVCRRSSVPPIGVQTARALPLILWFEARCRESAAVGLENWNCGTSLQRPTRIYRENPRRVTNSDKRPLLPTRRPNPETLARLAFLFEP